MRLPPHWWPERQPARRLADQRERFGGVLTSQGRHRDRIGRSAITRLARIAMQVSFFV
jgi:hypothetical protein